MLANARDDRPRHRGAVHAASVTLVLSSAAVGIVAAVVTGSKFSLVRQRFAIGAGNADRQSPR